MTEIKWSELLQLAKEKGITALQLRWMLDIVKPESDFDEIYKILDLAQFEIRAMYKRLGFTSSNVLQIIDEKMIDLKK